MKTFIIFIRGVMPSGKNRVPMAALRTALQKSGLKNVRTYIQSGNVLAQSNLSAYRTEKLVHDVILKRFGGDLVIAARTPDQVRKILAGNPFPSSVSARTFFTLLTGKPDKQKVMELSRRDFRPDKIVISDGVVYLHCPISYGKSKLNNNSIEKMLGISATTRNFNTMTKLLELGNQNR